MALARIPPHNFFRPSAWYYPVQKIEKCDFRVLPSGVNSTPNFFKTRQAVLELNYVDRHTDMISPHMHSFHAYITKTNKTSHLEFN
jgi:hypothetical protein